MHGMIIRLMQIIVNWINCNFYMNKILKKLFVLVCLSCTFTVYSQTKSLVAPKQTTMCNPVNLSYRFCLDAPSRREAADPTMVVFKNEYYLFASKSGGYFHSTDLIRWDLITTGNLPLEDSKPLRTSSDRRLAIGHCLTDGHPRHMALVSVLDDVLHRRL